MNCKATNQVTGEVRLYSFGLSSCQVESYSTSCIASDVRTEPRDEAWAEYCRLEWPWIKEGK